MVITAVVVEGRSQGEVARAYGVSQGWVSRLVARYRADGEAAFEPRSRRPKTSPQAIGDATASLITGLRKDPRQPRHRHPPPGPHRQTRRQRQRHLAPRRPPLPHRHRPGPRPNPRPAPGPGPAHPRHRRRHRRTPPRTDPRPCPQLPAHRPATRPTARHPTAAPQKEEPRTLIQVRGHSDLLRDHIERSSRLGLTWANMVWLGICRQVKRRVPTFVLAG